MSRTFLPFGKYAGEPVDSLPTQYLCWLLTIPQTRTDRDLLGACVEEVVERACSGVLIDDLLCGT